VSDTTPQLIVEAVDSVGNRTQLQIPVRAGSQPQPIEFRGGKYALIIGISRYRDEAIANLQYADVDAKSIYNFLQSPSGGRFSPDNTLLLLNEEATLANVKKALIEFTARAGPEDLLFIFFAGHGSPDPWAPHNLYFLTHDSRVEQLSDTALQMREFQKLLQEKVRARRLVIFVDACHSAGMAAPGQEQARGLRNNLVNLYVEKLLYREEGRAIITSSDVNEISAESPRWGGGHGVFTHFLLEGLRGRADSNGDRMITVGELFRFVRQQVRLETQFRQNPRLLLGTNENLVIAAR
jgi:uncharacterized caspase-like protein